MGLFIGCTYHSRMRLWVLCTFLVGLCIVVLVHGKGGGRGGGGSRGGGGWGGRSSSGSRGGWFGSRSSSGSRSGTSPRAWGSSTGGGRKNSIKSTSTLKKAAVLGAGVYSAYKLNKARKKFKKKKPKFHIDLDIEEQGDDDYIFTRWDSWRQADGFLCRNNNDCNWLDEDLRCEDYEVSILDQRRRSINQGWFGGQFMSVVGECHCQRFGQIWDNQELVCAGAATFLVSLGPLVMGLLVTMAEA